MSLINFILLAMLMIDISATICGRLQPIVGGILAFLLSLALVYFGGIVL